jgi:beta-lactamase regulating signal transducer with metallopeptidase domain
MVAQNVHPCVPHFPKTERARVSRRLIYMTPTQTYKSSNLHAIIYWALLLGLIQVEVEYAKER